MSTTDSSEFPESGPVIRNFRSLYLIVGQTTSEYRVTNYSQLNYFEQRAPERRRLDIAEETDDLKHFLARTAVAATVYMRGAGAAEKQMTADIVVVGGGAAGMAAVTQAVDAGKSDPA